jgi:N-methylhydantoinase B
MKFRPYGLAGGGPAAPTRNILNPAGEATPLPAKLTGTLRRGQSVRHEQAGGGGHGDPFARDPALIAADVANGKITAEYARREHGVVADPATGVVDVAATAALRARKASA